MKPSEQIDVGGMMRADLRRVMMGGRGMGKTQAKAVELAGFLRRHPNASLIAIAPGEDPGQSPAARDIVQHDKYEQLGVAAWQLVQRVRILLRHHGEPTYQAGRGLQHNRKEAVRLAIEEVERCLNQ